MTTAFAILMLVVYGWAKKVSDKEVTSGNVKDTWLYKYALTLSGNPARLTKLPWYYFRVYKPKYEEAFPFSSTLLVALTDKWHFHNSIQIWAMAAGMGVLAYGFSCMALAAIVAVKVIVGVTFEILYK